MKFVVWMFSSLCLTLAAPVDDHHQREARDASDEDFRVLLNEVKETLATLHTRPATPPDLPPETAPQVPQDIPQATPTIVLTPVGPVQPQVEAPPPQSSTPQINLFISTQPQQGGAVAPPPAPPPAFPQPPPPPGFPGQEVLIAGPGAEFGPILPHVGGPLLPQVGGQLLPQVGAQVGVAVPGTLPTQRVQMVEVLPNQEFQLNSPLSQFYPYVQPMTPMQGRLRQYPYNTPFMYPYMTPYNNPYNNPYMNMYNPYNIYRNYGPPAGALTPPIIFRERGQALSTPTP